MFTNSCRKNMKSLVYKGPQDFQIEEKPTPSIRSGEVLVKVLACGLCGTDVRIFKYGHHAVKVPITTGHEIVGKIVGIKIKNSKLKVGDHVVVVAPVTCMKCDYCLNDQKNMCSWMSDDVHAIGYYTDGGFAEYLRMPKEAMKQHALLKIPKTDVPLENFALCEPLSCVINGHEKLKVKPSDTVVVIGAGPIGRMHVHLAKIKGAKKIILADLKEKKLKLAKKVPADIFVNSSKKSLKKIVMKETKQKGADVIIIAASSQEAQEEAVDLAAIHGRISFFGGLPNNRPVISLKSNLVHYREIEIYGSFSSSRGQFEKALNLILNRKIDTKSIISHTFPLIDIKKAVKTVERGEAIKILIIP